MSKFRIWTDTGEPQIITADSVEYVRVPDVGLTVKFKRAGKKPEVIKGVSALQEITEKIKGK